MSTAAGSTASEAWDWIDECLEGWNGESSSENSQQDFTKKKLYTLI